MFGEYNMNLLSWSWPFNKMINNMSWEEMKYRTNVLWDWRNAKQMLYLYPCPRCCLTWFLTLTLIHPLSVICFRHIKFVGAKFTGSILMNYSPSDFVMHYSWIIHMPPLHDVSFARLHLNFSFASRELFWARPEACSATRRIQNPVWTLLSVATAFPY